MDLHPVVCSKPLTPIPAWGCKTILLEPYKEGIKRIAQGFSCGKEAPKLYQRPIKILTGLAFMIPLLNIVFYVVWRAICAAPKSGGPLPLPEPPNKPVIDHSNLQPPSEIDLSAYHKRLDKAVENAQTPLKNFSNAEYTADITRFIASIRSNCLEIIQKVSDDLLADQIVRNAEIELDGVATNIQFLFILQEQVKRERDAVTVSEAARQWAMKIKSFASPASASPASFPNTTFSAFEMLLREGSQKGFLNQKNPLFFSGTIFHDLAKLDKFKDHLTKLMQFSLDPSIGDSWGNTPLMWALANASNENAMLILNAMRSGRYLNVQCNLHRNTAMHLCVGKGYKDRDFDGNALKYSNLEILRKLVVLKADLNLKNVDGNTPLHLACARRDAAMIRTLLAAGANTKILNNQGKRPQDLLDLSHGQASDLIKHTLTVFLLPKNEFEANLKAAKDLFKFSINK